MNKNNKNEILLESGTNEIEIMEFRINNNLYGINVAKVREIMTSSDVTPLPLTHPVIEGIYKPRDFIITVFDLPKYLYGNDMKHGEKDIFIVTNFNKLNIAFRVTKVEGIVRLSWNQIQKPDKTVNGGDEGIATGITQINGEILTILDFEKIVAEISPLSGIQISEINKLSHREINNSHIIVVEDSIMLAKLIIESLTKAGFSNITKFDNGKEAWRYLENLTEKKNVADVALVVTDIEMPEMDGHKLTNLIKTHEYLKEIPVVIFSSMINEDLYLKGKDLGADEQITKPEIGNLVAVIDYLLEKKVKNNK